MNSDILKRVVRAIADGSQNDLDRLADKIVDAERRSGHTKLADQLEGVLKHRQPRSNGHSSKPVAEKSLHELPMSRRYGESLATLLKPEKLEHHMVLPAATEGRFARIEGEYAARERLGAFGLRPRNYIGLYGGDAKLLSESLQYVQQTSSQILNAIGADETFAQPA